MCICRVPPHTLACGVLIHSGTCPATQELPWVTQSGPVQPPNVDEGPWGQNGLGSAQSLKLTVWGPRNWKVWATLTSTAPGKTGSLGNRHSKHFYTFIILASGTVEWSVSSFLTRAASAHCRTELSA